MEHARDGLIVFIDDAHTLGGTQVALGWSIRTILELSDAKIICVCTDKTRGAVEGIAGLNPRLEFVRCPSALPVNSLLFPLRFRAFTKIITELRQKNVRAWWLNLAGIEFCLAPLVVLRRAGIVPQAYLHGTASFSFLYKTAAPWRRVMSWLRDQIANAWIFKLYVFIIAPSQSSASELRIRIGRDEKPEIGFLYYPPIGFQANVESSPDRPSRNIDAGILDLWMIGNVVIGHKNNMAALDVLVELQRRGYRAHLTVAGVGPDMENFKSVADRLGVSDRIEYLGWVSDPLRLVAKNGIIFIPSFYETMNLVARESMREGIRIAASPIPVFHEWIPSPFIARDFTAEAFADKVIEVHEMKDEVLLALYKDASEQFSKEKFCRKFFQYCIEQGSQKMEAR